MANKFIYFIAPQFFNFALTAVSLFGFLRLLNLPGLASLMDICLYASDGVFALWEAASEVMTHAIPWEVRWSPEVAWCCAVVSIGLLCRALFIPGRGIIVLAPLGGLAALVLFGG